MGQYHTEKLIPIIHTLSPAKPVSVPSPSRVPAPAPAPAPSPASGQGSASVPAGRSPAKETKRPLQECANCKVQREVVGNFDCRHALCVGCATDFLDGVHNKLQYTTKGLEIFCNLCYRQVLLEKIMLHCTHWTDISKLYETIDIMIQVVDSGASSNEGKSLACLMEQPWSRSAAQSARLL
jgi:hypothetical protein